MIVATFNGNPGATIISCYSPTNVSEETKLIDFYDELSSLVRSTPKHNVLVIGGNMNAQIGKNRNHKFRNGQHLTNFTIENRLTCLNTSFQKREEKLWTDTYPNNTKAQIDYVLINKKWNNSALNWWKCPWCNGYRRRKWTRRHEFKFWTRLIVFHIALILLGNYSPSIYG